MPRCADCDEKVELDEPRQCYYTGRGPCGDCDMHCFRPVLCEDCQLVEETGLPPVVVSVEPALRPDPGRRERRRQRIEDHLRTREYTERRKAELREQRGGRFA